MSWRTFPRVPTSRSAAPVLRRSLFAAVLTLTASCDDDVTGPNSAAGAEALLAQRPFAPEVPAYFPFYYMGTYSPPAPVRVWTLAESEQRLIAYADADPLVETPPALARFQAIGADAALRERITQPAFAAVLAALEGYPGGAAALDYYLDARTPAGLPKVRSIVYGTLFKEDGTVEENKVVHVTVFLETGQITYFVNERFAGEDPMLLVPAFLHEAVHQDEHVGREEETVAYLFQALATLLQRQHHPGLAPLATHLAQGANEIALALFNTGRGPALGLYASDGDRQVFPGSPSSFRGFADLYAHLASAPSPGSTLVAQYQRDFFQQPAPPCPSARLDQPLLECLDRAVQAASLRRDGFFSPEARLEMALALDLIIGRTTGAVAAPPSLPAGRSTVALDHGAIGSSGRRQWSGLNRGW